MNVDYFLLANENFKRIISNCESYHKCLKKSEKLPTKVLKQIIKTIKNYYNCKNLITKLKKITIQAGIEPAIFCLVGIRVIHCATGALLLISRLIYLLLIQLSWSFVYTIFFEFFAIQRCYSYLQITLQLAFLPYIRHCPRCLRTALDLIINFYLKQLNGLVFLR